MGLIKTFFGSLGNAVGSSATGVISDQWVDYIKCEPMPNHVLARKGYRYTGEKSSNKKGNDNVITSGSKVDVAEGQFMMIVENGKITEFCGEPGQYVYQADTQPSLLSGGFKGLGKSFLEVGKRFVGGGQEMTTQRVYYINTTEILSNNWGVGQVPFRDSEFGFTIKLGAYGEYSYHIFDPLLFFTNVCSTTLELEDYTRDKIDKQLKTEVQSALHPALGRVALKKVAYDQLPLHTTEICQEVNAELSAKWGKTRGIEVVSFAVGGVTPDDESAAKINEFQEMRVFTDARMMGARLGTAQAKAMETAAANESGSMHGFLGLGFAQQAGGMNAASLYQMDAAQGGQPMAAPAQAAPAQPQMAGWACACGAVNQGKFCPECGAKKPAGAPLYRCDKCGWQPADPANPPKFCPECGDPFQQEDQMN